MHRLAVVVLAASILSFPARAQTEDPAADDPLYHLNRAIFAFNEIVDRLFMEPVTRGYRFIMPDPAEKGVHNVLTNLKAPVVMANSLLQGKVGRTKTTLKRFVINTTAGVGGLMDVAAKTGTPPVDEDFGQTLAAWNVPEGPYLVLPLLGPSSPRDAVGKVVDHMVDPVRVKTRDSSSRDVERAGTARSVLRAIDKRKRMLDDIEDLRNTSIDYYAAVRSLYRQTQAESIRNGNADKESSRGYDFDFPAEN